MAMRKSLLGASLLLATAVLLSSVNAYHLCSTGGPCEMDSQILPFPDEIKEDFQFELRNIYTDRQRGARLNIFVKFRYYTPKIMKDYTTESGTFDYQDMKHVILEFVPAGAKGVPRDTFWEIVNREIVKAVWAQFPIRGLSIRMEVQGMSSGSIAGHRASTVTVGDIEPWVSSVNTFPGCDGMDVDAGNKACRVTPSWTGAGNNSKNSAWEALALNKTGSHDKPRTCDFCA